MPTNNAYAGISHPFGAAHSAGSKGGTSAHLKSSHGDSERFQGPTAWGTQSTGNYERWVSPDASLEERMYAHWNPQQGGSGYKPASNVVDVFAERKASLNPVRSHAQQKHVGLQPYTPDTAAAKQYYILGVRPLEGSLSRGFGNRFYPREQHIEHMHFLANNGENFGMLKDDFFGDGAVNSDKPENLKKYHTISEKYNARLIDMARGQLEEEWKHEERKHKQRIATRGPVRADTVRRRYVLFLNNCQEYIKQVVDRAATLATEKEPLLFK